MASIKSRIQEYRTSAQALWSQTFARPGAESGKLHKFVHFWILVVRSFVENRGPIRASALSYATLLALIPMLALAMSVTTSVLKDEGADQIEIFVQKLIDSVIPPAVLTTNDVDEIQGPPAPGQTYWAGNPAPATNSSPASESGQEAANPLVVASDGGTNVVVHAEEARVVLAQKEAARQIKQFIDNTSGATLGIPATIALVFVAISMLTRIEETFNDIWGVTQGRSWAMRIVIYWTTITLGPLLLAGALGLATGPQFKTVQTWLSHYRVIGSFIFTMLPVAMLWITFALLYKAVPNTKVHFSAALVGGVVAGSLWQLNNVVAFLYVSRVVTSYKIYGGLGLVLVFMSGLWLSWLILLLGAQVAYGFQNRSLYLQEKLAENVNQRGREFVALRLMTCLGQCFERGQKPPTTHQMSSELGIPTRLVQQVLQTMLAARLVTEVSGAEPAYAPARPLESITAHDVLMAMRAVQGQELITRDEPIRQEVYGEFTRIQEAEKAVASSVSMLALVNRAEARLELTPLPPPNEVHLSPALEPPPVQGTGENVSRPQEHANQPHTQEPSEPPPEAPQKSGSKIRVESEDQERDFPL